MRFPHIENISDVLPHLEGRQEFVIADKGLYTVIDYRYVMSDTFDNDIRKECRGLKFCSRTGELLARPLHKFFNWGEKPETGLTMVDFSKPHVVMEKMDGSMIHPCVLSSLDPEGGLVEEVVFMTRMGHTDVAKAAEALFMDAVVSEDEGFGLRRRDVLYRLVSDQRLMPIFEYVGPDNRIVEEYAEPRLVLLQVRDMDNGAYGGSLVRGIVAESLGVDLAPTYDAFTEHDDVLAVHDRTTGGEGVVIKFDDGMFIKVKTDEYRRLHRIKDDVSREHDLAIVILDDKLDDALPLFDAATKIKVETFRDELMNGLSDAVNRIHKLLIAGEGVDQKTFATVTLANENASIRSIAFTARKDGMPISAVEDFTRKHCHNAQKFEAVRLLTGAKLNAVSFFMDAA